MRNKALMDGIQRVGSRLWFMIKQRRPEICLVGGGIMVIAGTITACKATLELPDIVAGAKERIDSIHDLKDDCERKESELADETGTAEEAAIPVYTKEAARKDLTKVYISTGLKVAKLYAVPFALEFGGLGLIFNSHRIMRNRNAGLVMAYTAMDKAYSEYRKRVSEKYGDDAEKDLFYDIREETVEEATIDKKGNEKVFKKKVRKYGDPEKLGPYSKCYDAGCNGWTNDPELRVAWLRGREACWTATLHTRGYVFLNEILKELEIPETALGAIVGWVYDPSNPRLANSISFDLNNISRPSVRDFVNGWDDAVWLNFNVDGPIVDMAAKLGWLKEDREEV